MEERLMLDGSVTEISTLYFSSIHKPGMRKTDERIVLLNCAVANCYAEGGGWVPLCRNSAKIAARNLFRVERVVENHAFYKEIEENLGDYFEFKKGMYGYDGMRGYSPQMRMKQALFDLIGEVRFAPLSNLIELREKYEDVDDEGHKTEKVKQLKFRWVRDRIDMREQLEFINEKNRSHYVHAEFYVTDDPYSPDYNTTRFCPLQVCCRRIFNNDFDHGGRLYDIHGVQSVERSLVHTIVIDGNPTKECDFKYLHPSLLYAREGIELDFDPYEVDRVFPDMDKKNIRSFLKKALMAMINATTKKSALSCIQLMINKSGKGKGKGGLTEDERQSVARPGLNAEAFYDMLSKRNHSIAKYFSSGVGLMLQREDSDMAVEIMMRMYKSPVLPKHDSFIVLEKDLGQLKDTMSAVYREKTGFNIKLEVK
jgi:hypothetical protein